MALVPWLLLVRNTRGPAVFWWSWGIGVLFFLGSIWWLIHVTLVGWLLLCAYLAIYFGLFGVFVNQSMDHGPWTMVTMTPAVWVALEYLRSHFLSGFGWNLLAYSQTRWLTLIQCADLTGAWGVSYLIVLVNVAFTDLLTQRSRPSLRTLTLAVLAVVAALGYGVWRLQHLPAGPAVRVAVVQGNIPQEEKWDESQRESILTRYEALTREALRSRPHFIVWPETSTPGYLGLDEEITQRVSALSSSAGLPMLVGAPMGRLDGELWRTTNSAVLLDASGSIRQRYDKLHLVPFGEMVPFERVLPWLRHLLPPIGDFIPGTDYTVFHLGSAQSPQLAFSVLICFEDLFPEIARRFVREGARLLLVITNDAWFGPTAAAYQHAQASTFRAVELRVPLARAANTGWSGCIDALGRWIGRVQNADGTELFVSGTHTCDLRVGADRSLYLRWGDWFAILCLLGTMCWVGSQALTVFKSVSYVN